jgi:hypothetical protein
MKTVIIPKAFSFFVVSALLFSPIIPLSAVSPSHPAAQTQKQPKPGQPYALIFGTVWGPNDRPVYGVKVKIRRASDKPRKTRWELLSDHQGEFAQRIPAGKADYIVSADLKGFKSADGTTLHSGQDLPVHVEKDERVDISLHLTK